MPKTILIVDGAYVYKSSNALASQLDYLKLKKEIEIINGEPVYEAYYLNSTPNPPTDAQDGFHTWLKVAPPGGPKFRVQLYKLKGMHCKCPKCSHEFERDVQKGVDVGIATLILKLAHQNKYERVILLAGDGDFEDAIDYVKSEVGKEIWIAGFTGSVSADLQSYSDNMIWINDFLAKVKK